MFYMPHKPVVKQSAVTTKVLMVFDASAKPQPFTYGIKDCMFTGPPLQPLLWDIMVRVRMSTSLLLGDIEKAFLQIGVKEEGRDAVRFLFNINGTEKHLRAVVCKIRTILKSRCHTISPNWLKTGM